LTVRAYVTVRQKKCRLERGDERRGGRAVQRARRTTQQTAACNSDAAMRTGYKHSRNSSANLAMPMTSRRRSATTLLAREPTPPRAGQPLDDAARAENDDDDDDVASGVAAAAAVASSFAAPLPVAPRCRGSSSAIDICGRLLACVSAAAAHRENEPATRAQSGRSSANDRATQRAC
jgi:hypothetical protein